MSYCVISRVRRVSLFSLHTISFCRSVLGPKNGSTVAAGFTTDVLSTELMSTAELVLTEGLGGG